MSTENILPPSQPLPTIKLWTPRALSLITFFIGFPSSITLASINWIRMGMKGKAFAHIIGGGAGILLLSMIHGFYGNLFGIVINLGYMTYLRQQMNGDIEKLNNYRIQNAHWFGGVLISALGWGVAIALILVISFLQPLVPGTSLYYANRGDNRLEKGDYDQAIAEYTQAIRLDPEFTAAYFNRGFAYGNKGNYENAISDFTQVIKRAPKDAGAYFNRGLSYENLDQKNEAIKDFEQVLDLANDLNLRQDAERELQNLKAK